MSKRLSTGERLKILRGPYSQTVIANRAGVNFRFVSEAENGKPVPAKNLSRIVKTCEQMAREYLHQLQAALRESAA